MVIAEASVIIGICVGIYGIKKVSKKLGYKLQKSKIKKFLFEAFELLNIDMIKKAIVIIEDFDKRYNTKKLNKYLLQISQIWKEDDNKPNLNENNLLFLPNDFSINDIIEREDKKETIKEIEERRNKVLERKREIKKRQIKIKNNNNPRKSGAMG